MKRVYIFLANGFEETEAIGTWDTLKRGDIEAVFVSIYDKYEVEGAHGLRLNACLTLNDIKDNIVDAIVLPGGMPGAVNLYESDRLREIISAHHNAGKLLAAICAAPLVFGRMGLLKGVKATCYPGFEKELDGAISVSSPTSTDGNFVTGRGPAYALDFGTAILAKLSGDKSALDVADGLLLTER